MLIPTAKEIDDAVEDLEDGKLKTTDQRRLIRAAQTYPGSVDGSYPPFASGYYVGLAALLASAEGLDAQEIRAALTHIDDLGQDLNTLKIKGISINPDTDRIEWVGYWLSVLYQPPVIADPDEDPDATIPGLFDSAVGQSPNPAFSSCCTGCGHNLGQCICGGRIWPL